MFKKTESTDLPGEIDQVQQIKSLLDDKIVDFMTKLFPNLSSNKNPDIGMTYDADYARALTHLTRLYIDSKNISTVEKLNKTLIDAILKFKQDKTGPGKAAREIIQEVYNKLNSLPSKKWEQADPTTHQMSNAPLAQPKIKK